MPPRDCSSSSSKFFLWCVPCPIKSLVFFFLFFSFFHIINMAQIYDSRKPEPYIKASCKKCITPIEFYPQGQAVGQKVSVKCWACEQVETYTVTEPITSTPQTDAKSSASSKARSARKKGTGNMCAIELTADQQLIRLCLEYRSEPHLHRVLRDLGCCRHCNSRGNQKGIQKTCCYSPP